MIFLKSFYNCIILPLCKRFM